MRMCRDSRGVDNFVKAMLGQMLLESKEIHRNYKSIRQAVYPLINYLSV